MKPLPAHGTAYANAPDLATVIANADANALAIAADHGADLTATAADCANGNGRALDTAIVPAIAKALCRHTTRHPACACGDDPVVCFAMAIFGDQATAVARDLKRRGLLK